MTDDLPPRTKLLADVQKVYGSDPDEWDMTPTVFVVDVESEQVLVAPVMEVPGITFWDVALFALEHLSQIAGTPVAFGVYHEGWGVSIKTEDAPAYYGGQLPWPKDHPDRVEMRIVSTWDRETASMSTLNRGKEEWDPYPDLPVEKMPDSNFAELAKRTHQMIKE